MKFLLLLPLLFIAIISSAQTAENLDDSSMLYTCGDTSFAQISDAINHFEGIIKQDSTNKTAYYGLGISHYKLKQYDHAIRYFEVLIDIDPCYPNAIINLGFCYYFAGDKVKACEVWDSDIDCPIQAMELLMLVKEHCN